MNYFLKTKNYRLLPPRSRGMTLIEIVVATGIMAVVVSSVYFLSIQYYFSYATQSERNVLISVLLKARNEAINNVCYGVSCTGGRSHGVKIVYDPVTREIQKYVIFQGPTYVSTDPLNEEVNANYHLFFSDTGSIVSLLSFEQLSGRVSISGGGPDIIALTDNHNHSFNLTINTEGRIDW